MGFISGLAGEAYPGVAGQMHEHPGYEERCEHLGARGDHCRPAAVEPRVQEVVGIPAVEGAAPHEKIRNATG